MAGEMAYGAQPVYEVGGDKNDSGFGGSGSIWIILLFILLMGGNGGGLFGGGNGTAAAASNQITNEFLFNNLNSVLSTGFTQVANQNFAIQKDLCSGFGGVQAGMAELQHRQDMCCCETNRNIDSLRYEASKNTCEITTAIRADGEATRALITGNLIQDLRDRAVSAELTLGNAAQSQYILGSLGTYEPYGKRCGGCY